MFSCGHFTENSAISTDVYIYEIYTQVIYKPITLRHRASTELPGMQYAHGRQVTHSGE
jgi:hypothetical protein